MSFIFFILFLLFIIVFGVLSAGISFIKMLFGNSGNAGQNRNRYQYTQSGRSQQQHSASSHKKVFNRDEGEYVDYEDVK